MEKITDVLKKKGFTISVELVPPRNGIHQEKILSDLEKVKDKIDFISVTKGAGGSMRGGTIPLTYFSKEIGLNPVAHFVCRERTKYELENELMDLHYFGIKNILALRGDAPADHKEEVWDGDYIYAYLLAKQISNMNYGKYLPMTNSTDEYRDGFKTDFCIVVAGHPEDPIEEEARHMKCKVDAGADAIITQMIFSFEEYKEYVDGLKAASINLPVIAGIRPFMSFKQLESAENFFKIKICDELKNGLKNAGTKEAEFDFGVNYAADMIKKIQEYGGAGVHLFVLNDFDLVAEVIKRV
ncbi:methylenetetrahydrofolate reductase [archaeon]|nr:methylenetetrahydrofolate reductase [archaeon]MBL7057461.1 methylenetetrahydrofolate reductase [Candidatus Woesearchaeota archaeon]